MSFFRFQRGSIYGGPVALVAAWDHYAELDRTQWLPPAEMAEAQLARLRALLRHAGAEVPYYRRRFAEAGIEPDAIQTAEDFRRVPSLPRRIYQEQGIAMVAERLPLGSFASGERETSGSSGTPTVVYGTNTALEWWSAFYLRDLEWGGFDPARTVAAIRSLGKGKVREQLMDGLVAPNWGPPWGPVLVTGPAHAMHISQDPRRQLAWLRGVKPDYLLSYPSNLEALAALAADSGPLPGLRAVQAMSDTLTAGARLAIEANLGAPVKEVYSCAEAGYLATQCPTGTALHVHAENVVLEVVDTNGRPCGPGETGQVLLTALHNYRAPFIRYEIGDLATVGPASCPCGRGLPLLARVEGKTYPRFLLADGREKNTTDLARAVRKVGGHWQHQLVQKAPDHVVARVAVTPEWSPERVGQLRQAVTAFFEAAVRVEVEEHDRLPLPPSGKFQSMVREYDPPARPAG